MKERLLVYQLGVVPYEEAWQLQDRLAAQIARNETDPALLLLEHPHTYTFGRSGHPENLLWDQAELARRGVQVHWVDRGGDVTYHGPGQLVGYPLLPLAPISIQDMPGSSQEGQLRLPRADYVGYLHRLEGAIMAALQMLGVASRRVDGLTGVWIQAAGSERPAKVAAIGVKVDARGISRHGFALNINPDMSYWDGIIGCGLKDHPVTSLADLLDPVPSMTAMSRAIITAFGEAFGYEMVPAPARSLSGG